MSDIEQRLQLALETVQMAAQIAKSHYDAFDALQIESKGHQDLVSNADREVERVIRESLAAQFPDDGVVGEEYDNIASSSGYTWVIDPIDGTASFVRGRPGWCVVLACVDDSATLLGVVADPVTAETFHAVRGEGAWLNNRPIRVSGSRSLGDGAIGTGYSARVSGEFVLSVLRSLLIEHGGMLYQNGSGALMLSYVACGRLIGYTEYHMHAWDCMAAMLIVEEAGGNVNPLQAAQVLEQGTEVIAACPGVYDALLSLSQRAFSQ
jgi:myo-inositol-1(or 4)-monophosphatase